MPELPEVETMRRGIMGVVGARIAAVRRVPCRRKSISITPRIDRFQRLAAGHQVREVDRVGKRVVLRLDNGAAIVIEPRMTGLVLVANPPTREHLRWRLQLAGGPIHDVFYWDRRGLGSVRLLSEDEFAAAFGPDKLGPDAMLVTPEVLAQQLGTSCRAIKVALLDQRAVAGIGNLYASEILHTAGVHPARQCHRISHRQWQAIAAATREVLTEAIRYEGSTLGDGTYRNALNQQGSYQYHHLVYNRAGKLCPSCGRAQVVRIVQAQRSTFFCPKCQRRK